MAFATCIRCRGARIAGSHCLAHVTDTELRDLIRRFRKGATLNARRVTLTHSLLDRLLRDLTDPERGVPVLPRVDFGGARFPSDANFRSAVFQAAARFSEAHFEGAVNFRDAVFEGTHSLPGSAIQARGAVRLRRFRGRGLFRRCALRGAAALQRSELQGGGVVLEVDASRAPPSRSRDSRGTCGSTR